MFEASALGLESVAGDGDQESDLHAKLLFNAKALMTFACNLVTEADPDSNVQGDTLELLITSEKMMNFLGQNIDEDSLVLPFLIGLFNSMAKRAELRARLVSDQNYGISTLIKVFCA